MLYNNTDGGGGSNNFYIRIGRKLPYQHANSPYSSTLEITTVSVRTTNGFRRTSMRSQLKTVLVTNGTGRSSTSTSTSDSCIPTSTAQSLQSFRVPNSSHFGKLRITDIPEVVLIKMVHLVEDPVVPNELSSITIQWYSRYDQCFKHSGLQQQKNQLNSFHRRVVELVLEQPHFRPT